jgi:hypothetical protein
MTYSQKDRLGRIQHILLKNTARRSKLRKKFSKNIIVSIHICIEIHGICTEFFIEKIKIFKGGVTFMAYSRKIEKKFFPIFV